MTNRDLLRELGANLSLLLKRHVELARKETALELHRGKRLAGLLGAAGAMALAAITVLLVAVALVIGEAIGAPAWAGPLIVGAALALGAAVLGGLAYARRLRRPFSHSRRELEKELSWTRHRTT
jgi:hypothetical protein